MKRQMEGNNMSLIPPISLPLQNLVLKYPKQWFMGKWKQLHWFWVIKGWRAMAENLFCGNVDWDYRVSGLRWAMSTGCWNSSLSNETETESLRVENVFWCFLFHLFLVELLLVVLKREKKVYIRQHISWKQWNPNFTINPHFFKLQIFMLEFEK